MKKIFSIFLALCLLMSCLPTMAMAEDITVAAETEVEVKEETTPEPTKEPTPEPTKAPTPEPTKAPTPEPTKAPTPEPTSEPTKEPTPEPTAVPTTEATEEPTAVPTDAATEEPTVAPTDVATEEPSVAPTDAATEEPTVAPTDAATEEPTVAPTDAATEEPTAVPTTEEPTAAPTDAADEDLIDYSKSAEQNPAFTSGFGTLLKKAWMYRDDRLSTRRVLVPEDANIYVSSRQNNVLYVAVYTQNGLEEGYIKASFVRPLSPEQTTAHLNSAKKQKDTYAYGHDTDKLLTIVKCEFASAEQKNEPTAAPTEAPVAHQPQTVQTDALTFSFVPGSDVEPQQSKAALQISSFYASKTNPTLGENVTFRVNFTGGNAPYYVKHDLYVNNQYAESTGWYMADSYTTDALKLAVLKTAAVHSVVSVRDSKGTVVKKMSPIIHAAPALKVQKCQPNVKTAAPGTKITYTAVFSGGEKPYKYQMSLYKGNYQLNQGAWKTGQQYVFIPQGSGPYRVKVTVKDARNRTLTTFSSYCVVKIKPKYRALLIGQTYAGTVNQLNGTLNDRNAVGSVLASMTATPYGVTKKANLTAGGIISTINGVFGAATENDVSLFYYSGHGLQSSSTTYLGSLCGSDNNFVTPTQLRNALDKVKGKKIVLIDACHSGNMIGKSIGGKTLTEQQINQKITSSFINAFAGGSKSNLAAGNYYVLVAAHSTQTSVEVTYSGSSRSVGLFTYAFCRGAGYNELSQSATSLGADANGDKQLTLSEMYNYVRSYVSQQGFSQQTQVYPSGSSMVLFGRK